MLLSIGGWIALGVVVLLLVIIIIMCVNGYNKLVTSRNKVKNAWAQIDVQLKRRFDLIPNLVSTVKGYAEHEKDIWEAFASARGSYTRASQADDVEGMAKANQSLGNAISRLLIVQEKYPELQANSNFQSLMGDLRTSEDKIQYTRQFYNDTVMQYNNMCEVFPTVIFAGMFHFKPAKFFEVTDEAQREAPQVQF